MSCHSCKDIPKKKLTDKSFFFIKHMCYGKKNRRFVIGLLKRRISFIIRKSVPSPYSPEGIIYSTGSWFSYPLQKEMDGSWIRTIFPSHSLILKSPNSFSENVHPSFDKSDKVHNFPESYLYLLRNARVVNEAGSVLSFDNRVFSDFTMEYGKDIIDCEVFHTYIKKPLYIRGKVATIASCSTEYFHWIFDVFPRLKLLESVIKDLDYIIVPNTIKKIHYEMLHSIGVEENRILKISNGDHFLCEQLFVPTLPVRKLMMANWVCDYLRETFIPHDISYPYRKIYISRKDAVYRKIINEEELVDYLKSMDFEIIEMSSISFKEQVKICSEAQIIVSPHGAGLSNTVFCQNAKLFELFPSSYVNTCFWFLSNQVGNEYYYMIGEDANDTPSPVWRDFKIDVDLFKKTLNKVLSQ